LYCVAAALYFYFIDISENFRQISAKKNCKVSRNFARKKYKSRQNMANPNISYIFGSAGFIF